MDKDGNKLLVRMRTAQSKIFSGMVRSAVLQFTGAHVDIPSSKACYFTSFQQCELILNCGDWTLNYALSAGALSLEGITLTVIAESAEKVPPPPAEGDRFLKTPISEDSS